MSLIYSPEFWMGLKQYSIIVIVLTWLPAAYEYFKNNRYENFQKLIKYSNYLVVIYAVNVIISTIFELNRDLSLGTVFSFGGLQMTGGLTSIAIILYLYPLNNIDSTKFQKMFFLLISIFSFITLVLSLKRMSLIALIVGFSTILYKVSFKNKIKLLIYFVLVGIVITALSPYFMNGLINMYHRRGATRFEKNFYEEESRYLETQIIYEEFKKSGSLKKIFLGNGYRRVNEEIGVLAENNQRKIHIDYNYVIDQSGLIGLFLYLLYFSRVYIFYLNKRNRIESEKDKLLLSYMLGLLLMIIIIGFSGGIMHTTFRLLIFVYIGALMGVLSKKNEVYK